MAVCVIPVTTPGRVRDDPARTYDAVLAVVAARGMAGPYFDHGEAPRPAGGVGRLAAEFDIGCEEYRAADAGNDLPPERWR
jgi:hypothetical protein